MKAILRTAAALAMTACTAADGGDTGVVSGNADSVTVRATDGVDPRPAATAHCAKYGRQAVRRVVTPIPDADAPGTLLYPFACL
jgi:hypothetical protein